MRIYKKKRKKGESCDHGHYNQFVMKVNAKGYDYEVCLQCRRDYNKKRYHNYRKFKSQTKKGYINSILYSLGK